MSIVQTVMREVPPTSRLDEINIHAPGDHEGAMHFRYSRDYIRLGWWAGDVGNWRALYVGDLDTLIKSLQEMRDQLKNDDRSTIICTECGDEVTIKSGQHDICSGCLKKRDENA